MVVDINDIVLDANNPAMTGYYIRIPRLYGMKNFTKICFYIRRPIVFCYFGDTWLSHETENGYIDFRKALGLR